MGERISAFFLDFASADARFSTDEERVRRELVWKEVRGLMPIVDSLPNSRLVDRIGIRDGKLAMYFDLEYVGQRGISFDAHGYESALSLLFRDLEMLRESATMQKCAVFIDAAKPSASGLLSGRRHRSKADRMLHALMKKYEGQSLVLPFSGNPLHLHFPEYPELRYDGMVRTIRACVIQIRPARVQLSRIRYEGEVDPAAVTLGKTRQRYALLPQSMGRRELGVLLAAACFLGMEATLMVRTALDFLSGRISHYEIVSLLNRDSLESKLSSMLVPNL